MRKLFKPQALKQNDEIAIIAPSSNFEEDAFKRAITRLQSLGFHPRYLDTITAKQRYLAGSDERRGTELTHWLTQKQIKAIMTVRGGYGAGRLLETLNQQRSEFLPKILMGYSDFTCILNYFYQVMGWVTFQGPCLAKDFDTLKERGTNSLLKTLGETQALGEMAPPELITLVPGVTEGPLVGGCLSLVTCLLGTPYQLSTEGCILYLEDVGEKAYSIDRMLLHLRQAGLLKNIAGLVFGPLKDTHHDLNWVRDLLKELIYDLNVPTIFNFPCGHIADSLTIPMGVQVRLNANKASLTFLESACIP